MTVTKAELDKALADIILYMWEDEKRSWEECGEPEEGHIFNSLEIIYDYLYGEDE